MIIAEVDVYPDWVVRRGCQELWDTVVSRGLLRIDELAVALARIEQLEYELAKLKKEGQDHER